MVIPSPEAVKITLSQARNYLCAAAEVRKLAGLAQSDRPQSGDGMTTSRPTSPTQQTYEDPGHPGACPSGEDILCL